MLPFFYVVSGTSHFSLTRFRFFYGTSENDKNRTISKNEDFCAYMLFLLFKICVNRILVQLLYRETDILYEKTN